MPNTERVEPFLTLESRRYSIDGGRVTLLEVGCPELKFGMGIDVKKRGDTRLIDSFMQAVNDGVARYAAKNFAELEDQSDLADVVKQVHEQINQGIPLARLFKHP